MTPAVEQSGLIIATLDTLAAVIERCVTDPAFLDEHRARARAGILALHDERAIAREYTTLYAGLSPAIQPV
jgi:hypothetical protein